MNGYSKRKDRAPFDATELMKKIQEQLVLTQIQPLESYRTKLQRGTTSLLEGRLMWRPGIAEHKQSLPR